MCIFMLLENKIYFKVGRESLGYIDQLRKEKQ